MGVAICPLIGYIFGHGPPLLQIRRRAAALLAVALWLSSSKDRRGCQRRSCPFILTVDWICFSIDSLNRDFKDWISSPKQSGFILSSTLRKFQRSHQLREMALLWQTAIQMSEMPLQELRFQAHYNPISSRGFLMPLRSQKLLLWLHTMRLEATVESFFLWFFFAQVANLSPLTLRKSLLVH